MTYALAIKVGRCNTDNLVYFLLKAYMYAVIDLLLLVCLQGWGVLYHTSTANFIPFLLPTSLQLHWPPHSLFVPSSIPPQGLCTCFACCPEHSPQFSTWFSPSFMCHTSWNLFYLNLPARTSVIPCPSSWLVFLHKTLHSTTLYYYLFIVSWLPSPSE